MPRHSKKRDTTMEHRADASQRAVDFTVRQTSRDRCWTGFVATIFDATSGVDETRFSAHSVSMHVGRPVGITTRCDGLVAHRLQVPGDVKIVPAGYTRIWEVEAPTTKITLGLSPQLMWTAAEEMGIPFDATAIMPQLHVRDPQIEHIAWAVKAELETATPFGRVYADSLGLALAIHLLRRYGKTATISPTSGVASKRLNEVIAYIRDHIAEDLTLAELAGIAHVSQSHFKVVFKRAIGVPVHEYVVRTRVSHAIDLLLGDDAPLSEIALRAGFANQSHMALCMRRVTGKTPTAIRSSS
jgi:AraC family transcriptional regulator